MTDNIERNIKQKSTYINFTIYNLVIIKITNIDYIDNTNKVLIEFLKFTF